MSEWNPRWLAYCRTTGIAPDKAWERDGNGARFVVWTQQRWQEWADSIGRGEAYRARLASTVMVPMILGPAEHAAFDAWLEAATVPTDDDGQILLALEASDVG